MNSFTILMGMFNDFINEKELKNKVMKLGKMFEFIKSKNPNLVKVYNVKSKDYDDENGAAYDHYIVECQLAVADTTIPMDNLFGKKDATCLVNVEEYNRWVKNEESIKWI